MIISSWCGYTILIPFVLDNQDKNFLRGSSRQQPILGLRDSRVDASTITTVLMSVCFGLIVPIPTYTNIMHFLSSLIPLMKQALSVPVYPEQIFGLVLVEKLV